MDGGKVSLVADYGNTTFEAPAGAPEIDGDTATYRVTADGKTLTVRVVDRICADDMTGMPYPRTVRIEFDDRELSGCGGDPAELLQGAEWVVEDIDGAGIIDRSRGTLQFFPDGSVSGRAFCNTWRGSYALTGESLTFSQLATTRMACAPALMELEARFSEILVAVRHFEVSDDGALVLRDGENRSITARREY